MCLHLLASPNLTDAVPIRRPMNLERTPSSLICILVLGPSLSLRPPSKARTLGVRIRRCIANTISKPKFRFTY
ncbi:hypothetical protein CONLIGDRAFT_144877 [Coniochaeta ligniaria NRRL 30616]|uniref:Uncharacterized protein n=1 Tax=Coniochaeta ligniaria NRRL 30616 TaxID=1408157 RepID=A0A1J7I6E5_9PEZI|nr:hypothetical protein CONLIGDRAFT_144877 [Coniochaeta ligniaria NRRL 30616]